MAAMNAQEAEDRFQACYEDPGRYVGNYRVRRQFRAWLGDRFEEWHKKGEAAAEEKGGNAPELFREDWHPEGVEARRAERRFEVVAERLAALNEETRREYLAKFSRGYKAGWLDGYTRLHSAVPFSDWAWYKTVLPPEEVESLEARAEESLEKFMKSVEEV